METKYFFIPEIRIIENSVKPHFGKEVTIEIIENIYFRAFGIDMIIPKGFISNGNSFPFFIQAFYSGYDSRFLFASIAHDYFYGTQFIPRIIADLIYYYILMDTSGNPYAYTFYKGVRIGGWKAWRDVQKKGIEKYPRAKHDLESFLLKNGHD